MSSISEHIEQENIQHSSLWWLKNTVRTVKSQNPQINITNDPVITSPNKQLEIDISTSIDEFLEKDPDYNPRDDASEADIGSIIEEINKLASQSPIAFYEAPTDKSVEEIMQEAEKLYLESSKSFEQLSSSKSRTSLDYSISKSSSFRSKKSSPSPKSSQPKIQNFEKLDIISDKDRQTPENEDNSAELNNNENDQLEELSSHDINDNEPIDELDFEKDESEKDVLDNKEILDNRNIFDEQGNREIIEQLENLAAEKELILDKNEKKIEEISAEPEVMEESPDPEIPEEAEDVGELHQEIETLKIQLKETKKILKENEITSNKQACRIQHDLDGTIEELKDTKEQITALQLQLDNLTKTHQELKANYEELLNSKKNLELRINEIDTNFTKCRSELIFVKDNNDKLCESEFNLKKLLEIERLQSKTARLQNEKDAKCIQDLNRQVKEMERIIQRKHPDSVSALVTSKNDDSNFAARTLLENRIKQLETEATIREKQSSNVFSEIQEKFNQMKAKYESHIEDLEIHVNDLKTQLRTKTDTYDIYTQTYTDEVAKVIEIESKKDNKEIENKKEIIENKKETFTVSTQTDIKTTKPPARKIEKNDAKEDAHLVATIRGLQTDLTNKEKLLNKLNKELEELRKTNRKLQKDRESNLKLAVDNKSRIVEKIITKSPEPVHKPEAIEKDIKMVLEDRDKIKAQLSQLEDEYQNLKTKRLQDLNILQEAHEREITTYMSNIGPMREQLDVQQLSITNLQHQLATAKEELAIITVERDHLDARLKNIMVMEADKAPEDATTQLSLQKKIAYLERRYEEREHRLRTIVHNLAQKQVTTQGCEQCAIRQQQLIGYKAELDQIIATLRCEEYIKRRNPSTDVYGIEEYMV